MQTKLFKGYCSALRHHPEALEVSSSIRTLSFLKSSIFPLFFFLILATVFILAHIEILGPLRSLLADLPLKCYFPQSAISNLESLRARAAEHLLSEDITVFALFAVCYPWLVTSYFFANSISSLFFLRLPHRKISTMLSQALLKA